MHVMHAAIVSYCRVLYSCKRATTIFLTVAQINRAEALITAWPIFNLKYDLHEANLMGQSNTQCGYSETDARCSFCQNLAQIQNFLSIFPLQQNSCFDCFGAMTTFVFRLPVLTKVKSARCKYSLLPSRERNSDEVKVRSQIFIRVYTVSKPRLIMGNPAKYGPSRIRGIFRLVKIRPACQKST